MVPGSTLRYGSSFCIVTRRPRERRSRPRLLAVRPLPREEATPPVTKMCRVVDSDRPESRCARSVTGFQPTRRTPVAGEPDGVSPDTSAVRTAARSGSRGRGPARTAAAAAGPRCVRKSRSVARSPASTAPATTSAAITAPPAAAPSAVTGPCPATSATASTTHRPASAPTAAPATSTTAARTSPAVAGRPAARRSRTTASSAADEHAERAGLREREERRRAGRRRRVRARRRAAASRRRPCPSPTTLAVIADRPRSSAYSARDAWNISANPSRPGASQVIVGGHRPHGRSAARDRRRRCRSRPARPPPARRRRAPPPRGRRAGCRTPSARTRRARRTRPAARAGGTSTSPAGRRAPRTAGGTPAATRGRPTTCRRCRGRWRPAAPRAPRAAARRASRPRRTPAPPAVGPTPGGNRRVGRIRTPSRWTGTNIGKHIAATPSVVPQAEHGERAVRDGRRVVELTVRERGVDQVGRDHDEGRQHRGERRPEEPLVRLEHRVEQHRDAVHRHLDGEDGDEVLEEPSLRLVEVRPHGRDRPAAAPRGAAPSGTSTSSVQPNVADVIASTSLRSARDTGSASTRDQRAGERAARGDLEQDVGQRVRGVVDAADAPRRRTRAPGRGTGRTRARGSGPSRPRSSTAAPPSPASVRRAAGLTRTGPPAGRRDADPSRRSRAAPGCARSRA